MHMGIAAVSNIGQILFAGDVAISPSCNARIVTLGKLGKLGIRVTADRYRARAPNGKECGEGLNRLFQRI